jgi:hypothetical protein
MKSRTKIVLLVAAFAAVVVTLLIASSCSKRAIPDTSGARATPVEGAQFAYLLATSKIESESPDQLPKGSRNLYRIVAVQQQGNCVYGCPISTIYVVVWDANDWSPEHMKLFKIDGLRFYSSLHVTSYNPQASSGVFLTFRVNSRPSPQVVEPYEVSVSREGSVVKRVADTK